MKIFPQDGTIEAHVGEMFGIVREGHETAGYAVNVVVPSDVERLPPERELPQGFGGAAKVVERFRCKSAGDYSIKFVEGRPWETDRQTRVAKVHCR